MTGPAAVDVRVPTSDGTVLVGRRWDPPAGTSAVGRVVVVHGLGDHAGRYDELARALAGGGWRVVAVDQRGHGRSPGRRGVLRNLDTLVDDVVSVAAWARRELDAPGDPVLLGHSMGGLVALRTLQTRDEAWRAVVLSAPWLATALPVAAWKRALEPFLARLLPDVTVPSGLKSEHLTRDPERMRARDADPLAHDRASAGLAVAVAAAQKAALASSVPSGVPVVLVLPGADPVTDVSVAREWARTRGGPEVEVVGLEGWRHEPHQERGRRDFFRDLLTWLDRPRGAQQSTREWVSSSGHAPDP